MNQPRYVLVTPARNEEATIGITVESVLAQSTLPLEWVVVSDGSVDGTDKIVSDYARKNPFLRLLRVESGPLHNFASVVAATEAGCRALRCRDFTYLGLLDADLCFAPDYFARLISYMEADPGLGLAGGLVLDVVKGERPRQRQYLGDVAGAVQFFRRSCFDSLGGLVAIPEGGWDAITCVQARANGYGTRTFSDLVVEHLKPRNSAVGGVWRRKWQMGLRDYALGSDPLFELGKCLLRMGEPPLVVGSLARWTAFVWSIVRRRGRCLSPDLIAQLRAEQRMRMQPWRRTRAGHLQRKKKEGIEP